MRESAGGWVSSAVAADGSLHLAYMNWSGPRNDVAEYAVHDASGWRFETVDAQGNAGYQTCLLLSGGQPFVLLGERSTRFTSGRNVLAAIAKAKLAGLVSNHPAQYAYPTSGSGLWRFA